MKKRSVIITGINSGLGRELSSYLINKGFYVIGTYINDKPMPDNDNLFQIRMDIRKAEDIAALYEKTKEVIDENELYALINNAGVAYYGPVEDLPISLYRENFEVNYFGHVQVIQKFIPAIIRNKGRILLIGSLAGLVSLPYFSPYTSSKFALEALADSLRRELACLGVKVIMIEPSGIATPIWNKGREQDTSFVSEKYKEPLKSGSTKMIDGGNSGYDPLKAAIDIYNIMNKNKPKARYIVSKKKLYDKLTTMLPDGILDYFIAKLFGTDKTKL